MEDAIMDLSEEALDYLEQHIPEQATMALKQAYWQALASGNNVLVCEDGELVERRPDGTRKILKKIPPSTTTIPGKRWEIR
jgi:hypothetical protein